ncbi:hypothetical protein A7K73_07725 [Candidatus Methylacidiphilum fumarolicum]|uniref:Uncharacterized protein n=2 Tax=Candidatus Methylacidiphilum fumarolicum TaxID=591154 RepID=I0JVY5_METFB|nr:hypothetical protein [Candidatus Methylacidiphilum fumarolicum]TFE68449.1 hypothetical protein A7K73_07725 [Candidatus Methylacidiphilum fumarolicum]TFE77095.1 hypothetical protein A7D33_06660 [Candidatus Methylacidiphilum fumarolicum]CAI9086085.1 conserved protein of unknown function [Candidatus Methylacidiphilum fumarolicum]CCG91404.1 conserved hypothetical protein [Methylacidiphilum fumariolicum SolV]
MIFTLPLALKRLCRQKESTDCNDVCLIKKKRTGFGSWVSKNVKKNIAFIFAFLSFPLLCFGHGGSDNGGMECGILSQGGYAIHLDVYVYGRMGQFKTYCQNIPNTGKMTMVFDLITPDLRTIPLEVKVVDESTGKPILEVPPKLYSSGVASIDVTFEKTGKYMTHITLVKGDGSNPIVFKFPINVGLTSFLTSPIVMGSIVLGIVVVGAFIFFFVSKRRREAASSIASSKA